MFHQQPSDLIVRLDMPVDLLCIAYGIPELDYFWFRVNGMTETPVELDTRVMEVNGTLTIAMATREDSGTYICVAKNVRGNVTSDPVQLTVLGMSVLLCPLLTCDLVTCTNSSSFAS